MTTLLAQDIGSAFQNAASSGPLLLAIAACTLAGLVSFASPCVVPLVPGYLSYLAGIAGADAQSADTRSPGTSTIGTSSTELANRWRVAGAASLFVAGFTIVFVLATASIFGVIGTLRINEQVLQRVGGVITIIMGAAFIGLIPVLQRDTRFAPQQISSLAGAPLLGGVFALGWTPCLVPPSPAFCLLRQEPKVQPQLAGSLSSSRTAWGSAYRSSSSRSVRVRRCAGWGGFGGTHRRSRSRAVSS